MAPLRRVRDVRTFAALLALAFGTMGCCARCAPCGPCESGGIAGSNEATSIAEQGSSFYGIPIRSSHVVFVIDPAAVPKHFITPTPGTLLVSNDEGKTWRSPPGRELGFALRGAGGNAIYAAVHGQMYESKDEGATWTLTPLAPGTQAPDDR